MRVPRTWQPFVVFALAWSGDARGEADAPQYASWAKVEAAPETREYLDQLRKGGVDDKATGFLQRTALPQLAEEGNRKSIERIRKRMREVMFNERAADAASLDAANRTAVEWLTAQARNAEAEPVVRVNEMLLVGELRGKDGRPWPGAVPSLAAATADPKLAAAVRVAAMAGLARHLEAARAAGAADPALGQQVAPKLLEIVAAQPAADDGPAGEWLVSRALDMLPATGQTTPASAAPLAALLEDAARPIDVRVRAAAALALLATPESKVDASRAVTAIRGLAITALTTDITAAAERALSRMLGGQSSPAPMMAMPQREFGGPRGIPGMGDGPGATIADMEPPLDSLVGRRDAWRLMTLANAIQARDRGLAALLLGDEKAAAEKLAEVLREAATNLDGMPDTATMKEALAAVERVAKPAAGPARTTPAGAADDDPAPAGANDPFGAAGS
jgi:hypothetical protein